MIGLNLLLLLFAFVAVKSQGSANGEENRYGEANDIFVTKLGTKSSFKGICKWCEDGVIDYFDDINDPHTIPYGRRGEGRPSVKYLSDNGKMLQVLPNGDQYETRFSGNWLSARVDEDESGRVRGSRGNCPSCGDDNDDNDEGDEEGDEGERRRRRLQVECCAPDDRYQVTGGPWSYSSPPYKHVGLIRFCDNSGSCYMCSGTLISPRHVLTAGHCLHEGNGGDWYDVSSYQFWPGRTSTWGSSSYSASTIAAFSGWTQNGQTDWDIGIITLTTTNTGLGWPSFGYGGVSIGDWIYTKAYCGDKPWGSMWSTSSTVSNMWTYQYHTDNSYTVGGMSGGGWYNYPNGPRIWAPHHGTTGTYNIHVRITSTTFNAICNYMNQPSVC